MLVELYRTIFKTRAPQALQLVLPFLDSAEVQAEAAQAVTKIAGALRGADSELARAALKKVLAATTDATRLQAAEAILKQMPPDEYPHLTEFMVEHVLRPGYDYGDEYEFGLDLILDALERSRDAAPSAT